MTASVTEELPLLSSAPGGIKGLRQLIMDLAIAGRLVPQIESEASPKSVLVATSKMRVGERKTPRSTALTGADADTRRLPSSWLQVEV